MNNISVLNFMYKTEPAPSHFFRRIMHLFYLAVLFLSYISLYAQSDKPEWTFRSQLKIIRYTKSIKTAADFGLKKSIWSKFRQSVSGSPDNSNLLSPQGIAISNNGCLAFTEPTLRQIRIFNPNKNEQKMINAINEERFVSPVDIEFDNAGNIYISDSGLKKIFMLDSDYKLVRQFGMKNEFIRPTGIAINNVRQLIYIVDTVQNCVFAYNKMGEQKFKFGKRGTATGEFNFPTYICVGDSDKIYVIDTFNFRIQILSATGEPLAAFGQAGQSFGYFAQPKGIAVDSDENIYVADAILGCIHIFDSSGSLQVGVGNNENITNLFSMPTDIAISTDDVIYVADSYHYQIQVFESVKSNP